MSFFHSKHRHYLLRILFLLGSLIFIGVAGFMLIEGWGFEDALYMVIITLTTIGYQEVHELSPEGRWFNIFFILFGLGIAGYSLSFLSSYVLEGKFKKYLTHKYMENKIKKLNDHYILCGFGKNGNQIAAEFVRTGISFVVIDSDPNTREECEEKGFLFIEGDASDEKNLKLADIERAHGLVAVVSKDADNVFIVLTARSLNPDLYIIARANEESSIPKLHQAGANKTSISHRVSGYHLASMAVHPTVIDFLDIVTHSKKNNGYFIEEVLIPADSKVVGGPAGDHFSREKQKVSLLAIFREGDDPIIHPSEEVTVSAGDRLVLMGHRTDLDRVFAMIEEK